MPHRTQWDYAFAILPHRCYVTKKWIWFGKHYKITDIYLTYADTYTNTKWLQKEVGVEIILTYGRCELTDVIKFMDGLHAKWSAVKI